MTRIRDLARGVVAAGIPGTTFDPEWPRLGGYIVFEHNGATLETMRAFTDSLRMGDEELEPLVGVDQEGGRVARLRDAVQTMPSMMALGATGNAVLAQRAGEAIAFDLRRAGCTLDFAPVLDLAIDADNTVIGTRSLGADPQEVARLGAAFARGLLRGGIIPCYKHFPGHGATAVDSHYALPRIEAAEATLRARELIPFAAVAREAPAMMSAHVVAAAFDATQPATLSSRIATDLLRAELGFRGVLVTDCLEMHALKASDSSLNAIDALVAGADLLLFSHDLDGAFAAIGAIEEAVNDSRLAIERLEEAYERIRRLRRLASAPVALDAAAPHPGVGREIARKAVTVVRGLPHADPVASIAVAFGAEDARKLQHEAPALQTLAAATGSHPESTASLLEKLAASQRRPIVLARRAHQDFVQAQIIEQIIERFPDALVVSLLEPIDVPRFAKARHLVATYGDDIASIGGLADVLFGGAFPAGRLPVALS